MCGVTANNQEGNYQVNDLQLKDNKRAAFVSILGLAFLRVDGIVEHVRAVWSGDSWEWTELEKISPIVLAWRGMEAAGISGTSLAEFVRFIMSLATSCSVSQKELHFKSRAIVDNWGVISRGLFWVDKSELKVGFRVHER